MEERDRAATVVRTRQRDFFKPGGTQPLGLLAHVGAGVADVVEAGTAFREVARGAARRVGRRNQHLDGGFAVANGEVVVVGLLGREVAADGPVRAPFLDHEAELVAQHRTRLIDRVRD